MPEPGFLAGAGVEIFTRLRLLLLLYSTLNILYLRDPSMTICKYDYDYDYDDYDSDDYDFDDYDYDDYDYDDFDYDSDYDYDYG